MLLVKQPLGDIMDPRQLHEWVLFVLEVQQAKMTNILDPKCCWHIVIIASEQKLAILPPSS